MSLGMKSVSASRPQFLVGLFLGICLASVFMQILLVSLGGRGGRGGRGGGRGGHRLPPSTLGRDSQSAAQSRKERSIPDSYEVHNVGLRLHAADKTRDSHVVKYFEDDELLDLDLVDSLGSEDILGGQEAGGRRPVYAGVLTDHVRLAEQAAVVRMTWGAELPTVQFFFNTGDDRPGRTKREHTREVIGLSDLVAKDTFTAKHTSETLRHVCSHHRDDYRWYVLVRDATYISTSGLLRILDRMSASEDIIIGRLDSARDGACPASPGVVLSSAALARLCARVETCSRSPSVERCLRLQCVSSKKILPDFHVTSAHGQLDVGWLVGDADHSPHLVDEAVFIGTLPHTRDFYKLHLHFTRARIRRTQHEIHRLGQELTRTRTPGRAPHDKADVDVEQRAQETAIFGAELLVNKTSEPFYQFIDNSGNMYLETCKVRKQDVGKEASSPYRAALELAKNSLGLVAQGLAYFTYKVTKPNVGIEYQFYFIQTITHKPAIGSTRKKVTREKVHQVTILHPYGKLEMESKEIQPVKTINFVIPSSGSADTLDNFLVNYENVCLTKGPDRCSLLMILFHKPHGVHASGGLHSRLMRQRLVLLEERYPGTRSQVMEVAGESMTLARTVQMADSAFEREDLLAFLPPDVTFTEDFLFRCQLNTFSAKRAYFPIVYQQYADHAKSPTPAPLPGMSADFLNLVEGYWENSDFTTFSAYNEDIQMFDNLPSSPRDLHNMFKASEYMGVFRAPDPGLTRPWRKHVCSMSNLTDKKNCIKELKYMNMQ